MPKPFICKICGYDMELSPRHECKDEAQNQEVKRKKFAATYSVAVQIGEYEYKQIRTTKVFSYEDSILKVVEWLESIGVKNPDINSVEISGVDE